MNHFFIYLLIFTQLITESLPVSSSGHVQLIIFIMSLLTGIHFILPEAYLYGMHGPTSLIIAVFFRKHWLFLLKNIKRCLNLIFRLLYFGILAELPTLIIYYNMKQSFDEFPLSLGFLITGLMLLSLKYCKIPYRKMGALTSFIIGCAQGISLIPGISRLCSTYVTGRWLGLNPYKSFVFSCTIEWPLITAGFLKSFFDIKKASLNINHGIIFCLLIASILSYIVLKITEQLILSNRLWILSFYMFFISMLSFALFYFNP